MSAGDKARLYYEAHITVEAGTEDQWEGFARASRSVGWRASKFSEDEVDDMSGKWFLSYRHEILDVVKATIIGSVRGITSLGFQVLRYKIEDTLLDSKHGDTIEGLENILKD
jgi:hypothetical protein